MMQPTPINPEAIKAEAQKAAWLYSDINSACPYPFGSLAAEIFKAEFEIAIQTMNYGKAASAS